MCTVICSNYWMILAEKIEGKGLSSRATGEKKSHKQRNGMEIARVPSIMISKMNNAYNLN